jgi:hypothetical protein
MFYHESAKMENVFKNGTPGEYEDGNGIPNESEDANTIEKDSRDPELEDWVIHLVRRQMLKQNR